MKKFKFRLHSVLTLREFHAQKAFAKYQRFLQKRQRLQEIKRNLQIALQGQINNLEKGETERFYAFYEKNFSLIIQDTIAQISNINQTISNAQDEEKKAFQYFLKLKQKVDTLLKLKENQLQKHTALEAKKEEREIEDIINSRHAYNS
ncbi:MAG: hypothetical protein COZ46_04570 [Verrucomicrobia bacterium CG_4_10_14_3_um_filter_43_23]|nr:MAG: hypothetical protein AUJ82_06295 [Verrucomicrobia bacterium CG1_02_43_26]PIP58817.1 MAG: hypothetical protein COX01_06845 [Verrucomicrobia bacterium CG22_combo_CG10-13_8_21_14_all_43_17]PIX58296.1 MAG: hypothetical protein COZ46_04570 [Verrucomicrobia bacterium CG_4_10_14_3_um_filter_43_23]PIY62004.1 MAG: hypothetical protein COY94_03155 [Verrucomicrobia bacterium CG_4_10_14_0_8_um_filter_43_34]PJA44018.1 MAG: hypothetical protein CO175_05040 [Verrucomicrobia bacterium CG_4_9_14_3_um_fi